MATDPSVLSAHTMITAGRPHEAIPVLLARLRRDATDAWALSLLGMAFSMIGNHADAQLFANRAVELAPNDERILATLVAVSAAATDAPAGSSVAGPTAPVPLVASAASPQGAAMPVLYMSHASPTGPQTNARLLTEASASWAAAGQAPDASLPPQSNADIVGELAAIGFVAGAVKRPRKSDLWRVSAAGAVSTLAAVAYVIFRLSREAGRPTNDSMLPVFPVMIIGVACIGAVVVATRWYLGLRRAPIEMRQAIAHERRRRRSRVVVALFVAALALVVGGAVVAAELATSGMTPSTELTAGACYLRPKSDTVPKVRTVPCTESHDSEIIGTVPLSSVGTVFPSMDALNRYAIAACETPFRQYVGRPYRGRGTDPLWLTDMVPQQSYWDQGIRIAWCVAMDGHNKPLVHSVRGFAP